jgi:hypothetical protein
MISSHIRSRLRDAVDALTDDELQERLWLRGDRLTADELTFDDAVLFIIDELATPHPDELIDHVLRDETELQAFLGLVSALDRLVTVIGERGTYADAMKAGAPWHESVDAARPLGSLLHE